MKTINVYLFTKKSLQNDTIIFIVFLHQRIVWIEKEKSNSSTSVIDTRTPVKNCYFLLQIFNPLPTPNLHWIHNMMLCMMLLALSVWNKLFNLLMCRIGTLFMHNVQREGCLKNRVPSEHSTQVGFFSLWTFQRVTFSSTFSLCNVEAVAFFYLISSFFCVKMFI